MTVPESCVNLPDSLKQSLTGIYSITFLFASQQVCVARLTVGGSTANNAGGHLSYNF
jgi:hypothetical protein